MIATLLCGHGHFATGLSSSLEMIAGEQTAFVAVDFTNENAGTFAFDLKDAIIKLKDEYGQVVVFCDLMGGTPFNQAMLISAEVEGVEVVAGTSLPILLETAMAKETAESAKELAQLAVETGQVSVVNPELPKVAEADQTLDDLDGGI